MLGSDIVETEAMPRYLDIIRVKAVVWCVSDSRHHYCGVRFLFRRGRPHVCAGERAVAESLLGALCISQTMSLPLRLDQD